MKRISIIFIVTLIILTGCQNKKMNNKVEYSVNDEEIIKKLSSLEAEAQKIIQTSSYENAKKEVGNMFVNVINFIFYDTKIKGVTFKELSTKTQAKILKIAQDIDTLVEEKFPNYKNELTEKTGKLYIKTKETLATMLKDYEETIEQEEYDKIKDSYQEFKDSVSTYYHEHKDDFNSLKNTIKDAYNKGKDVVQSSFKNLKDWYENKKKD